jgi:hypothetical protein
VKTSTSTATRRPRPEAAIITPPLDDFHTLDYLRAKLLDAGYVERVPHTLTLETRFADQRTCAHMKCPACRCRGLAYRPFRNANKYRVIASCPDCNAAEEI